MSIFELSWEALPTLSFSAYLPSILLPIPHLWLWQDPASGTNWILKESGLMNLKCFLTPLLLHAGKSSSKQAVAERNHLFICSRD